MTNFQSRRNLKRVPRWNVWELGIGNWEFRSRFSANGYAALTTIILAVIVSLVVVGGFTFFALQEVGINRIFTKSIDALYIAESGIEDMVWRVMSGKQTGSPETLGVGKGTTTINVTVTPDNKRIIRSDGQRDGVRRSLETRIDLSITNASFIYGAQVGGGGLEMENNATLNGSVFSNGTIIGDNGAVITGDAFAASNSQISFMAVDGNAQAFIIATSSIGGYATSTNLFHNSSSGKDVHADKIINSAVTADAYYYDVIINSTVLGSSFPGNPGPPTLSPIPLPISDATINQWKQEAEQLGTIASGGCGQDWTPPTSPYTLNGGVLDRNLVLTNNQILIMRGTIWVKCNVDISNGATIRLDSAYGDTSGALVADGWMHLQNNGQFQGSGVAGSYLMLLTTASGGGHHGSAIDLHNNAGGAIFYAQNGMIFLHQNVSVTELIGYRLHMENNSVLTYEIGLQNVRFSAGPAGGYDLKYWKEVE